MCFISDFLWVMCVGNKAQASLRTAWNRDAVSSGLRRMAELPKCGLFLLICIFLLRHDKVQQHIYLEGPVLAPWIPAEY